MAAQGYRKIAQVRVKNGFEHHHRSGANSPVSASAASSSKTNTCLFFAMSLASMSLILIYSSMAMLSFRGGTDKPKFKTLALATSQYSSCMNKMAKRTTLDELHALINPKYSTIVSGSKTVLFSIYSGECHGYLLPATAARNVAYAKLWNYTFLAFTAPLPFNCDKNLGKGEDLTNYFKMQKYIISRALLQHHRQVFYLDSDAAVYQCEHPVSRFIGRSTVVHLTSQDESMPLLLNTGTFILNSSRIAETFLDTIIASAASKPINPVSRYYNQKTINLSEHDGYSKNKTIYDQRIVTDVVASLPFYVVDTYFKFLTSENFQCLMQNARYCKYNATFPYVIHCAGTCTRPLLPVNEKGQILYPECDKKERSVQLLKAFDRRPCRNLEI